ncbi:MAG: hypothetical protein ACI4AB_07410 [Acetatifactor sp.]
MEKEKILVAAELIGLFKEILPELPEIKEIVKGKYGFIHRQTPAEVHGIKGFLIWDFILYNEITFKAMDGVIISLFTSFSDEETEAEWNKLEKKFGV